MSATTQSRLTYVAIALLLAFGAFMLWKNWASVKGAAGIGGTPTAAGGGGGSWLDKAKKTLIPSHSFDPRKGSIANPAGYVIGPVAGFFTSVF